MPEKIGPQDARQGARGNRVLMVLVVAIVLAIAAWAIAEMFGESTDPQQPVGEAVEGVSGTETETAPAEDVPTVQPVD